MKFLINKKITIAWLTLLILTNILSIYFITHGYFNLPNTVVLSNDSQEFLNEMVKLNHLNEAINKGYVGEINNEALGETLIESMFNFLGDPYSEYYNAQEYDELMNSFNSSFGGIGVIIDGSDPNNLIIVETIEGSPAQAAGILPNDIITKVNGENIVGMEVDQVVEKTRGQKGTPVTITILRDGEEINFELVRDEIQSKTVTSTVEDNIGIISIESFGFGTNKEFEEEVQKLTDQGVSGIVIDLRNNGGGIVQSAVEVADILLDEDQVGYAVSNGNHREYFTTKNGKVSVPYVVLVNEYTASASELLSGSLQKSGTTIIGKNTFGKGVIQKIAKLSDGTGYKLTVQEYFLKDDSPVNKKGIIPDIVVDNELDENNKFVDKQLQTALDYLHNQ